MMAFCNCLLNQINRVTKECTDLVFYLSGYIYQYSLFLCIGWKILVSFDFSLKGSSCNGFCKLDLLVISVLLPLRMCHATVFWLPRFLMRSYVLILLRGPWMWQIASAWLHLSFSLYLSTIWLLYVSVWISVYFIWNLLCFLSVYINLPK